MNKGMKQYRYVFFLCLFLGSMASWQGTVITVRAGEVKESGEAWKKEEVGETETAVKPGEELGSEEEKDMTGELSKLFLKADGKVLRNDAGKGEEVVLRGTNIGGWQVMEAWMCPTTAADQRTAIAVLTERFGKEKADELFRIYEEAWVTEQDFDNFKELNFNVVRLPLSCYRLLDEEGRLRADTMAALDWFVEECGKREIYVILDLHAAPGSQNGKDHSGDTSGSILFTDEASQQQTISLWEQLAQHYRGNPVIAGYDLLNEPEGAESERHPWGGVQLPFMDRLYRAIRAVDPDHIIIFNAIWDPAHMPKPSEYGWENVMYEYHYYGWDGIGDAVAQRKFTDSKVVNDRQAGFDVPVLVGEFTLFEKLNSWAYALKVYEENGWSWTTWTYKTVDQGSWGIYNSTAGTTPKVDIYNDSEEKIRSKWSKVGTAESFQKNRTLFDLLRVAAAGKNTTVKDASAGAGRWFQNAELGGMALRAGTDASADIVPASKIRSDAENGQVIQLVVEGAERRPTATSRNVCITPAIRDSVDTTGLDYLLFDAYVPKGNQALQVTLADKDGRTWSSFTSAQVMPSAYGWEKLYLDMTDADIDRTAIIEIRIGANYMGTYYFDNIYFADSYAAPLPEETAEEMALDKGVKGTVTDWNDIPESSRSGENAPKAEKDKPWRGWKAAAIAGVVFCGIVLSWIGYRRYRKR